ncbi:MAG: CotH kinase family protein [Saprospiraceae bacterium]|nr:CotH kinase family protein [Saprospiraceae bacterium]
MKKNTLLAVCCLHISAIAFSQSLYNPAILQEIKINFYQSNWDYLLDSLKSLDHGDYLLVPSVEINGQVFDSVGVKYKGNSSYSENNAKNPMHIKLDYIRKNQNYQGVEDLKLSNGFADPTFVREVLSYEILRNYMDAPVANYARVYINGAYWGVYGNVESINKRFLRNHFKTDGENAFFKCNPEDFGGPGTGGNYPDLVYSSADSTFYYNKYDIQSDYGWLELMMLMDTLKNHPNSAHAILDVDRALWMLAFNTLLVNLDSYTGAFAQNYYLYHDRNERFIPINWDLNMSFGAFPLLSAGGPGGALSLTQMKQLDPLTQSTNSNRPLIKQLLSNPTYKRMYIAHMRTMLQEQFSNDDYYNRAQELQNVIDASIQEDTHKFYSYTSFKNNLTQSVTGGFGNVPGITDLMSGRKTFLTSNVNFTAAPPSISQVELSLNNIANVQAQVQNATTVWLAWRADSSDVFQKVTMYDDGAHNDGAASDGVYGGSFPLEDPTMQYYIYAENNNAGIFSPERAEHEFYLTNPVLPGVGEVVINELLAINTAGEVDEAGEYDDWLEMYNNTNHAIPLTGLYLSDDSSDRNKWAFPAGVSIPAHGYLIVWLDDDNLQGPYHANFKLDQAGEQVIFSDGASQVLDSVVFGQQLPDITFGRYPNGTGNFTFMPPTFSAQNSLTIKTLEAGLGDLRISPNPFGNKVFIRGNAPLEKVIVFDSYGRILFDQNIDQNEVQILAETWPAGVYFVQVAGYRSKAIIVKIN